MELFLESGYVSLNKYGEELCGDRVESIYHDDSMTLVLADGLGSGVKANILSTLTSKIICTMMAQGMPIEDCVQTIAGSLPVCNVRKIAYSTFTILNVDKQGNAYMVQFDNPNMIVLRDGKSLEYEMKTRTIEGKKIHESYLKAQKGDIFIMMSDGTIHAGIGTILNFGWQWENIRDYIVEHYEFSMSAKTVAATIAQACQDLYMDKPGDDTTVAVMRIREWQQVNIMVGPPVNPEDDEPIVKEFLGNPGKKIVCGGTTSSIVSKYLGVPVTTELNYVDTGVPPIGHMQGIDLVTEGVVTLGRVLDICKQAVSDSNTDTMLYDKRDGATLITKMLFEEATHVKFYVGRAINPAHQNPDLPIDLSIKLRLVEEIQEKLEKMGKIVSVKFY